MHVILKFLNEDLGVPFIILKNVCFFCKPVLIQQELTAYNVSTEIVSFRKRHK